MKKIIISGEGGQGVRVISHTLATLLSNLGYEVTLLYDYDSQVRGAMSVAYLIYDTQPIANPTVTEADLLLMLSRKARGLSATKTVCDTAVCTEEELPAAEVDEAIPFERLGMEKFGREIFGNMIALGRLLRLIDLEVKAEELAGVLPLKYQEANIKAVLYGYRLREEDLGHGTISTLDRRVSFEAEAPSQGDLEAMEAGLV